MIRICSWLIAVVSLIELIVLGLWNEVMLWILIVIVLETFCSAKRISATTASDLVTLQETVLMSPSVTTVAFQGTLQRNALQSHGAGTAENRVT